MIEAGEPAFDRHSRDTNLRRLRSEVFDVLILGGGINGAGIARDLTLRARRQNRPLRVALIEKSQFGSGTSGKNSQLIHGGLRYLKYFEFRLVKEALRERATLLRIAPHLVEPLPFLIPFYGPLDRYYYGAGLMLYDLLAGTCNVGRRRHLTRDEVASLEPNFALDGLASAAIYFDCAVHSARLVLENVFDAARDGAVACNYTRFEEYRRESGVFEVKVTDVAGGESFAVTARALVDTTGPWQRTAKLRLVRGSHLVLPRLNSSDNAIAYFNADGRIIFVIPWGAEHELSLVGTTDCDHAGGPDAVRIDPAEARYLLEIAGRLFPTARGMNPIAAFSSLRPLVEDASSSATGTSREHKIGHTADGVLAVSGGKYTTYRSMSEEAAEMVAAGVASDLVGKGATAETALGGNSAEWLGRAVEDAGRVAESYGISPARSERFIRDYGRLYSKVLEDAPAGPADGLSPLRLAGLLFAVEHEMALRLADALYVSSYWGYEEEWPPEKALSAARVMGRRLGWDDERCRSEAEQARQIAAPPV